MIERVFWGVITTRMLFFFPSNNSDECTTLRGNEITTQLPGESTTILVVFRDSFHCSCDSLHYDHDSLYYFSAVTLGASSH